MLFTMNLKIYFLRPHTTV